MSQGSVLSSQSRGPRGRVDPQVPPLLNSAALPMECLGDSGPRTKKCCLVLQASPRDQERPSETTWAQQFQAPSVSPLLCSVVLCYPKNSGTPQPPNPSTVMGPSPMGFNLKLVLLPPWASVYPSVKWEGWTQRAFRYLPVSSFGALKGQNTGV